MKKIIGILIALALVLSFSVVAVPVVASPADGDVTIVVQDQSGTPIKGAMAILLFYGGGKGGYIMPPWRSTDGSGIATFTAAEIAEWLTAEGFNPTLQIYIQPNAKVETDSAYGKVRSVDRTTGFPCIPYNTPDGGLAPKPAMSFTYKMIMMSTEPVQTVWDDPNNNFTVTATLADSLSVTPDVTKMRLIRNLVGDQPPAPGGSDDDWYFGGERWIGIGTEAATVTDTSVSATFSQGIFEGWEDGNKAVVRTEFLFLDRIIGGVTYMDDYCAVDILRPSSYIHPAQINDSDLFYPTIQDAIDAAVAYDTITVAAGTYDEGGLKINKSLTISGTGTVTITGTKGAFDSDLKFHGTGAPGTKVLGSMDYVVGVYNSADVDFVNVTIDGGNNLSQPSSSQYFAGVAFYNAQGSFSDCEIKRTASNPESCDGAAVSIYIDTDSGTWELEVKDNCIFNTWPKNAISAYGSGSTLSNVLTVDVDDSIFTGNDGSGPSDGFQNGIVGLGGLDMEVDSCTFSAIRPAVDKGYWAAPVLAGYAYKGDSTKYAPAHDLTVNNCTFSVTGDKFVKRSGGVWITTTGTAVVEDCTFTNIKGISVDGSNSCDGVPGNFNPSSQDVTIRNCTFNGPSYPASVNYYMCGVNIQRGAQVDIENCTFNGFDDDGSTAAGLGGDAVAFNLAHFDLNYYTGSTGGSVTGCTFSGCSAGIWSDQDVTPLTISNNNFDGSNEYGVWNDDADDTIDAENNWWGDASGPSPVGPGTGDNVSANVDYEPWLMSEGGAETTETETATGANVTARTDHASAEATGGDETTTVTVAEYVGNPSSVNPGFAADGFFFDVHVGGELPTQLVVEIECLGGDCTGVVMRWFDGTVWRNVRPQEIVNGKIRATLSDTSSPRISDLTGTPFGEGRPTGCFIATAAYGTPTAEQIDVLREFRDVVLLESTVGSQFVALYYQLSPPIADFIAGNELLRTVVRKFLIDPIVRVVEATGDMWRN